VYWTDFVFDGVVVNMEVAIFEVSHRSSAERLAVFCSIAESFWISSCKFIVLLFVYKGQEVFEVRQDVVGRGDTLQLFNLFE
jgi:hypothetical protein